MTFQHSEHELAREPKRLEFGDGIIELNGEPVSPEFETKFKEYMSHFVAPHEMKCVKCGTTLGGLFGSFRWGIAHGQGECSRCGWPAIAYHFLEDETGKEHRFELLLQLHPDDVSKKA